MKNTLITPAVFSLTVLTFLISCQRNNSVAPSQSAQIIGKWTVKDAIGQYTLSGQVQNDTTTFAAPDYFDFRSDNTVTIVMEDSTYNGNWQITNNRLLFTGTNYLDAYVKGFMLPVLNSNTLQLEYQDTTAGNALDQKLDLFR